MLYLSNFATSGTADNAVSIARFAPKWYKGMRRKELAPSVSLLKRYKNSNGSLYKEFTIEYIGYIYETFDFDDLAAQLDGKIILCWCSKHNYCHRLLLAKHLQIETGIEVEELGGFGDVLTMPFDELGPFVSFPVVDEELKSHGIMDGVGSWRAIKKLGMLDKYKVAEEANYA
jgi:uncharacterized protein YeaO (DUF488 family)